MPQLPSGRHFAFKAGSLFELYEEALLEAKFVHELMAIETTSHLFKHIDILYFKEKESDESTMSFMENSDIPPEDLEAYSSGFTLYTILEKAQNWSDEDQEFFVEYLESAKVREYLNSLLKDVEEKKQLILSDSSPQLQRMLATMWQLGCHPLQDSDDE